MAEMVHKVTLSTGKVVLIRDMKIKHQELAAQAVGNRHSDAQLAQGMAVQNELVKILLVSVDDKEVRSHDNLDDLFSMGEYKQVLKAIEKIGGGDEGAPLLEVVSSGSK